METHTFKDRNGKTWDATLTLAGAKRIDASDFSEVTKKEFSILDPGSTFFEDVLKTPAVLWAMLFAVVKPQVKKNLGIDPDEEPIKAEVMFCEGLLGESMDNARDAFWAAIADFFPASKTALLALIRLTKKANARVGKNLRTMEPKMDELMDLSIDKETKKVEEKLKKMLSEANA